MRARDSVRCAASVTIAWLRGGEPSAVSRSCHSRSFACTMSKATWPTIPSAPVARMSYPRAGEPRPAALPPGERTIGQLVAESIRLYGSRFWAVIPLGVPLAAEHVAGLHQSSNGQMLLFWAFGPLLTAAYVYACTLTSAERPPPRVLASAYLA